MSTAFQEFVLAFADDELSMGHRHAEWLGIAPFLEEDLAFASIGQDELGHARGLYGLLNEDVDVVAFGRTPSEFRSSHCVELPCRSWELALVRHYLYDLAESIRWENLGASSDGRLAGLAARASREEAFHVAHAEPMMHRMLSGTDESRRRVLGALTTMYPYACSLFEASAGEDELVGAGVIAAASTVLYDQWLARVRSSLAAVGVELAWDAAWVGQGARWGERSEHFAEMWDTMTAVSSIDPQARW